jgi:glycosyltransferase involved in cell wall biosynthesis
MPRIGIDARELLGATTGVGRYLGELLRRWVARNDAATRRFTLYSPEPLQLSWPREFLDVRVIGAGRGTMWEQRDLRKAIREDAPDVFFAPAYTAPIGLRMPFAVTIHDVSFAAHPEWFRTREGLRRRLLTRYAATHAATVFTDSEFSQREIVRTMSIASDRIRVIPPGGPSPVPHATPLAEREPLVLFVGSLFNRRRLPELIAAFARAARDVPQARLAIVGDDRTWPRQSLPSVAQHRGVADRVEISSYLPDAELHRLYERARVFAFLSEYEGFGLTPLEAMAHGVPAVVLDTPVAREVYGETAFYVPPHDDVRVAADTIRTLLLDPAAADSRMAAVPALLARYSWERAASQTLEHLERLAIR